MTLDEAQRLASALDVSVGELWIEDLTFEQDVVVTRRAASTPRFFGGVDETSAAYRLWPLARSPHQPQLKSFVIDVLNGGADLLVSLHTYIYNFGEKAVTVELPTRSVVLSKDDS